MNKIKKTLRLTTLSEHYHYTLLGIYGVIMPEENLQHQLLAAINRLNERMDSIETRIDEINTQVSEIPNLVGIFTDSADEYAQKSYEKTGISFDQRTEKALEVLEKLTEPESAEMITSLLDRSENLQKMIEHLDTVPDMVAILFDTIDEMQSRAIQAGINFDGLRYSFKSAGQKLVEMVDSGEFDNLIESGIFGQRAVNTVGLMGKSMVESRNNIKPAGLFKILRSVGNKDIKRAIGFLLAFGKAFGKALEENPECIPEDVKPKNMAVRN